MRVSLFIVATLAASVAAAQQPPTPAAPVPEGLRAIVRGLYMEAQVGGGYTVAQSKIEEEDPFHPGTKGDAEGLGPGSTLLVALGFDIADAFALEIVGGAALISGTHETRVRDMSLTFVGAGARLAFGLSDRTNFLITPAGIYVKADNAVEKPDLGTGVLVSMGLEYYVHVRHFSIGLEVSAIAPLEPLRVFVAL